MTVPAGHRTPQKITLSALSRQTSDKGLAILEKTDPAVAQRLQKMRATRPDKPTVVVVGEAKRGKSSLTNALINVPGLSPVDARVATSTYIMFRRGPKTAARALMPGSDDPIDVPLENMRDWATDLGSRPQYAPPRLIEVECDSPLLGNLNIVDTPGVGGLDASHAEIALRAISRATALLFVCDASTPFTKPELDFLLQASKTIDLVIFAVTKTDAYRGWRTVVEDNRALLRTHAPRFADAEMLPVSAKLFEQAGLMGSSDLAVTLRKESNIIDLQIKLQQQIAIKASALHDANLLRTMRSQLIALDSVLLESRKACQPDLAYAARVKENRDQLLAARRTDSRAWQLRLRAQLSRARLDTMADISAEQRKFLTHWRRRIEESDKNQLQQIAPQLDVALKVASMRIFDRQQGRLRNVSRSVLQSMFQQSELAEVYAALQRPRQLAAAVGPDRKTMTADEKVITGMSLMSAVSLGKLASMPLEAGIAGALGITGGAAGLIMLPVVIGIGIGAASWMVWARRTAADRNNLKIWLNETLGETRSKLEADASAFFIEAEHELTLALDRALGRRIETLDGHIKQIDNSLKVDRGERERRVAEVTIKINQVRDVLRTIDTLLPRLRNAVVETKQPATTEPASAPVAPQMMPAPSFIAAPEPAHSASTPEAPSAPANSMSEAPTAPAAAAQPIAPEPTPICAAPPPTPPISAQFGTLSSVPVPDSAQFGSPVAPEESHAPAAPAPLPVPATPAESSKPQRGPAKVAAIAAIAAARRAQQQHERQQQTEQS